MNPNSARSDLASCETRLIGAPLFRRVHRLCLLFHSLRHAYKRFVFQVLFSFHRLVELYLFLFRDKDLSVAEVRRLFCALLLSHPVSFPS